MKAKRGQFFTINKRVQSEMMNLLSIKDESEILEPSFGAGHLAFALLREFPEKRVRLTGWEIDEEIKPIEDIREVNFMNGDFFRLSQGEEEKYDVIFGNPPFVAWKNVESPVQESITELMGEQNQKTNLYSLFIDRSIDLLKKDGELVFIVPKEWLYSTSSASLRKKLVENGSLTHIIDCEEEKLFPDADMQSLIIFRYQKTIGLTLKTKSLNDQVWSEKIFKFSNGGFIFADESLKKFLEYPTVLESFFDIKVGLTTGANDVYRITDPALLPELEREGTLREILTTKGVEKFLWVEEYQDFEEIPEKTREYLSEHKEDLMNRKIQEFSEKNWWRWGAIRNLSFMESGMEAIYVYNKTRNKTPFFLTDSRTTGLFTGALLALYPKQDLFTSSISREDLEETVKVLNSDEYRELFRSMGLTSTNKISFQPATLGRVPFVDLC